MANTFTPKAGAQTQWGNHSVIIGTLNMDDGAAGTAASTPLVNVLFAACQLNGKVCGLTATGSTVAALTAASNASMTVIIIGR